MYQVSVQYNIYWRSKTKHRTHRYREQIVGCHYELDDFQIQAVTEGREAMGEALIKLRFDGVLYSGRGISTDIMGASIKAYLNALNKIVYEDD